MDLIIAKTQTTISGPRDPGNAIVVNKQGLQGAAGISTLSLIAAANLSGHRLCRADLTGKAEYSDNTVLIDAGMTIGVTTGAALIGALATLQTFGEMSDVSFSFTPGAAIYVGTNGMLTQTPPSGGAAFSQIIGVAITATSLFLNIQLPIIL